MQADFAKKISIYDISFDKKSYLCTLYNKRDWLFIHFIPNLKHIFYDNGNQKKSLHLRKRKSRR